MTEYFKTNIPWIEKYRPKSLNDLCGNEEIIERLKNMHKTRDVSHMILVGPSGTGKTSSIISLAKDILGEKFSEAIVELNASDERGIDIVRNKIKNFSLKKISFDNFNYKIIILDEADSMTPSAQQALRRTIETYSKTTRFALSCNNLSSIIEPIQSRCLILKYHRVYPEEMSSRIAYICDCENIKYDEESILYLCSLSGGDMRQTINNLQSVGTLFSELNEENINACIDVPHPKIIKDILRNSLDDEYKLGIEKINKLVKQGFSPGDIMNSFMNIVKTFEMEMEVKIIIFELITKYQIRLSEGVQGCLQLYGFLGNIVSIKNLKT